MKARPFLVFGIFLLMMGTQLAPAQDAVEQPPVPMPQDRVADSFLIYTQLMPELDAVDRRLPHDLWFVQDATINAVEADQPCFTLPDKEHQKGAVYGLNPHTGVKVPEEYKEAFKEIFADFDSHCHEHWRLDAGHWKLRSPVQLLTPAEQLDFQASRGVGPNAGQKIDPRYKKSYAMFAFSPVYFNHDHTVALVYTTLWCGEFCGQGKWAAFTRTAKDWIPLQINATLWVS
jgi:hypothetical protein